MALVHLSLEQVHLRDIAQDSPKFGPAKHSADSLLAKFRLSLPHGCYLDLHPRHTSLGPTIFVDYLHVPGYLNGNGIAKRLFSSLVAKARSEDVQLIESEVINPAAVKVQADVVGEENVHYYNIENRGRELPMWSDRAALSVARSEQSWHKYLAEHPEEVVPFSVGLFVISHITDVDVSGFELPVQQ